MGLRERTVHSAASETREKDRASRVADRLARPFQSLQHRDYRWLWIGLLFSYGAIQMNMVARGWLVYELTSSAVALGLVMSMWGFSVLFLSPLGGVIADRVPKRNLMIATQGGTGAVTAVIAVLITLDMIQLWHLIVYSLISGALFAFNMPARQALLSELVPEDQAMNAIALGSSAMNLMRVLAPALAGVLVELIGVGGVYWIVVGCYFFVVVSLLRVRVPKGQVSAASRDTVVADMAAGVRYVWGRSEVLALLAMGFLTILLGWNYQALLPAFAVENLKTSAGGYGALTAMSGVGALVGTIAVATLGNFRWKGALMTAMAVAFSGTIILFALTRTYSTAVGAIMLIGLTSTAFTTINTTLLQMTAPPEMRGRVMSLMLMTWGVQPLGVLPFSVLADAATPAIAIGLGGALLLVLVPVMVVARPRLLRL